jgi:hypothetical protein
MSNKRENDAPTEHAVEVVGTRPAVLQAQGRQYEMEELEPEEVMARIEKWNEVLDQVTNFALQRTKPRHWCALGEKNNTKPWLTGPGAENMVKRCGLKVDYCDPPYIIESGKDSDGAFVNYTCRLRVGLGRWASIVAEGHCTSRDRFFNRGGRLSHARIDKGNLQQSAYTNALVNGVCRLLGIRNLTWDELREVTNGGVEADKCTTAEFGSGKQGGVSRGRREAMATKEQRVRVWHDWCDAMNIDRRNIPGDAGRRFYDWAVSLLGDEAKRDKEKWTEADAKVLVEGAAQLAKAGPDGSVDAPDVPPADAPPAE